MDLDGNQVISGKSLAQCKRSQITLTAKLGQQLNISVVDFKWNSTGKSCHESYGVIKDSISSNSMEICGASRREKNESKPSK